MIKYWLVTGDTHGRVAERLSHIDQTLYPPTETALIILGDAGLNFYLNKTDLKEKRRVNETGYRLYLVRGNHEERPENLYMDIIEDPDIKGSVYQEPEFPNIRYLLDGGEYQFGPYNALVIGGAYSVDKWYRLQQAAAKNQSFTGWFPDEQLYEDEMKAIQEKVKGKTYSFVFTHTCPRSYEPRDLFLPMIDQSMVDKTMENWLDNIKNTFNWGVWCFAHYHQDRIERPFVEQFYRDIEDLNDIAKGWTNYLKTGELDWWLEKSSYFDLAAEEYWDKNTD